MTTSSNTLYTFDELNNTQRQNMAERLVRREIISCETSVVNFILQVTDNAEYSSIAPFSRDDIVNDDYFSTVVIEGQEFELTQSGAQEKIDEYSELFNEALDCDDEESQKLYQEIIDELESLDFDEQREIYQWFKVSGFLADKLENYNEIVLDNTYWGRTCCGQATCLDYVIQCIAFDVYSRDGKISAEHVERL